MEQILERWLEAIGSRCTTRWYIMTVDRDRPSTYVRIVEFPDHEAAMSNSDHPATAAFAAELRAICTHGPVFRYLDVTEYANLDQM